MEVNAKCMMYNKITQEKGGTMRLDAFLSRFAGIFRSQSRKLIKAGRVKVDGTKVRDPGSKIPENSPVFLDGNRIVPYSKLYIAMNKPAGYVCSKNRMEGSSVFDLIDEVFSSELSIAGRLGILKSQV